jgi:hypothetical protein
VRFHIRLDGIRFCLGSRLYDHIMILGRVREGHTCHQSEVYGTQEHCIRKLVSARCLVFAKSITSPASSTRTANPVNLSSGILPARMAFGVSRKAGCQ